ncbi:MAG: hypothetical protein E7616_03455 [Ruminococcaceae bacterium]|nr:hypothetical protein [Oscillospiraceae bacterium]
MSKRVWNPQQKNALAVRNRDTLVSAAAGSGKTAVLCQRILDRITDKEHPLELSRLLIVTFTNAAAAEMRARLQKGISEALAEHPGAHLRRQSMMLHRANICTIDKYCISFVKSHFHLLGVSPDVGIAEDSAISDIKRRIMQKTIDRYYETEPAFAATSDLFVTDRDEKDFPDTLIKLHSNLSTFAMGTGAILQVANDLEKAAENGLFDSKWGKILQEDLLQRLELYRAQCIEVRDRYSACVLKKGKMASDEPDAHIAIVNTLIEPLSRGDAAGFFHALHNKPKYPTRLLPHDDYADAFIKYARDPFKADFQNSETLGIQFDPASIAPLYHALAAHCRILYRLISEYESALMEEKKKLNLLEFSDMERMTLSLLEDANGEITDLAKELRNDFDEIFIDEYQDVNDIQNRIFTCLANGNRFLVGDVKQSIYGFRYADPTIFSSLRASFADYTEENAPTCRIFMQNNYRCDKAVVDFTNTVCNTLFPHCRGMYYMPEDALVYSKTEADKNIPVEVHLTKKNEHFFPDAANAEGAFLAHRIEQLIAQGRRPCEIAVLCRSLGSVTVSALTEELGKRGIPLAVSGMSSYFEQPEILLTLSLLYAVDNPTKDIPLAAVLRSPLFGFRDKELIEIGILEAETLWGKLQIAAEYGDAKAAHVLAVLDTYRCIAAEEGVDALLFTLLESPDFRIAVYEAQASDSVEERLEYLYGIALGTDSLGSFLSRIERLRAEGIKERKDRDQNTNKVRIMTIHGAKGLEFPVCCLMDCGKYFNSHPPDAGDFDPYLGPAVSLKDPLGYANLACVQESARKWEAYNRDLDEEMRILYVALTRAKEHLILTGTPKTASISTFMAKCRFYASVNHRKVLSENPSYLAWVLISLLGSGKEDCYGIYENGILYSGKAQPVPCIHADPMTDAKGEDSPDIDCETAAKLEERLIARRDFAYPHAIACRIPAKLSVSTLKEDLLTEDENAALLRSDSAITLKKPRFLDAGTLRADPARRGSATHAVMQFCDFAYAKANGAKAEIERQRAYGFLSDTDAEIADPSAIDRFFASDLYKEMEKAKTIYRERRFMITLPAKTFTSDAGAADEELLVQGVIDCFFMDSLDRIWLIDYKTDHFPSKMSEKEAEKELILRHGTQMRYYREALYRLCGKEVYRSLIYSFHLNRAVTLPNEDRKDTP